MVDYVDGVESEIAVGKPIKASTGLKMVRNFLAIITGGAGAPKIENAAFADKSISGIKLVHNSMPDKSVGGAALIHNSIPDESVSGAALIHNSIPDESVSGAALMTASVPMDKLGAIAAGNIEISDRYAGVVVYKESYVKSISLRSFVTGTVRLKWKVISYHSHTTWFKIYRNGVAVGNELSFSGAGDNYLSADITCNNGDLIELYGKIEYETDGYFCYVSNVHFCGDKAISIVSINESTEGESGFEYPGLPPI